MAWINTVTGRTAPSGLGLTLVHEHLSSGFPGWFMAKAVPAERLGKIPPHWEPTHLFKRILPRMKELGLTEAEIQTMLAENPARYFAGVEPPR